MENYPQTVVNLGDILKENNYRRGNSVLFD